MMTMHQLREKLKLSPATIYKFIKTAGFPAPHKFGSASRWKESEVDSWIASQRNS